MVWDSVDGADDYRIYRSETTDISDASLITNFSYFMQRISDMDGNIIDWQAKDSTATPGQTYYYWFCAVSINGSVVIEGDWAGPESGYILTPDEYEPDNQFELATSIPIDGSEQIHAIVPSTDVDWVRFDIVETIGVDIIIDLLGSVSTSLLVELYGPNSPETLIASDAGTTSPSSKKSLSISRSNDNALTPGRYYIKVLMDGLAFIHQYSLSINAIMLWEVPDVIGLSQANAESTITSADFMVGTITSVHSDTVPAGNVITQSPVSGSLVVIDSAVDIVCCIVN